MFETIVHWIAGIEPYRIGLMARPCGGEMLREEVQAWHAASVNTVVSLLESHEVRDLDLGEEAAICDEFGISFYRFSIPDRGTPQSMRETFSLVAELHSKLVQGESLLIHCRAGIGRTGLLAACLLYKLNVPRSEIFKVLSKSRGTSMPDTSAQAAWVDKFARAYPNQA
ncbi:MAG: tyrosine-protein phosphatase [Pseudomonadota bacterium]